MVSDPSLKDWKKKHDFSNEALTDHVYFCIFRLRLGKILRREFKLFIKFLIFLEPSEKNKFLWIKNKYWFKYKKFLLCIEYIFILNNFWSWYFFEFQDQKIRIFSLKILDPFFLIFEIVVQQSQYKNNKVIFFDPFVIIFKRVAIVVGIRHTTIFIVSLIFWDRKNHLALLLYWLIIVLFFLYSQDRPKTPVFGPFSVLFLLFLPGSPPSQLCIESPIFVWGTYYSM